MCGPVLSLFIKAINMLTPKCQLLMSAPVQKLDKVRHAACRFVFPSENWKQVAYSPDAPCVRLGSCVECNIADGN
jgi:hypothetical protein